MGDIALPLLAGKRHTNVLRFTVSHTAGFTITPEITRHVGCPHTATWDWGDGSALETGDSMSHAYAAGTYNVTLRLPRADRWLAGINMSYDRVVGDALLALRGCRNLTNITLPTNAGLNSAHSLATLRGWWPLLTYLYLASTQSLITGTLADLPAGMEYLSLSDTQSTITGALADLPVGMEYLSLRNTQSAITGGGAATSRKLTTVRLDSLGLDQPAVDSILWSLYQAAITPRTETGGTINLGGTNAAPSGTFQAAASCPVTEDTDGAEIAHELLNDGCGEGFNKWATVTITAP